MPDSRWGFPSGPISDSEPMSVSPWQGPIDLRNDFDSVDHLRRLAKRTRDLRPRPRLLALAQVLRCLGSRTDSARGSAASVCTDHSLTGCCDFNARGPDRSSMPKSPRTPTAQRSDAPPNAASAALLRPAQKPTLRQRRALRGARTWRRWLARRLRHLARRDHGRARVARPRLRQDSR